MKRATVALLFFLLCPSSLPAQSQKTLLLGLASISGGIETLYVNLSTGASLPNLIKAALSTGCIRKDNLHQEGREEHED